MGPRQDFSVVVSATLAGLLLSACSTLHIPNAGFEDSVAVGRNQFEATAGVGSSKSLNFNDYESSEAKQSIKHTDVGNLNLGISSGLMRNFEVGVYSYSAIPFPTVVGMKYQYVGGAGDEGPFTAAASFKVGYSLFANQGGYSAIGGTCGANNTGCAEDPNGRWVGGHLVASILSLPFGYEFTDSFRATLTPQISYYDGKYTLSKKTADQVVRATEFGLSGTRLTLGATGFYRIGEFAEAQLSLQFNDYRWNGIPGHQDVSAYVGISYLLGSG